MPDTERPPHLANLLDSQRSPGAPVPARDKRLGEAQTKLAPVPSALLQAAMPKVCPVCSVRYPAEFKVCPRDAVELTEADTEQERDEIVGTTLGQTYSIVRAIGEGGMGRVYEARHTRIGSKRFAIKMLHPEFSRQAEVITRFQREAEAAASIKSPYVVDVYDVDRTADGRPYMVGEYLEGKEFAEYLNDNGKMQPAPAVRIVRQICNALSAAHAKGVIHRDMKPENVFLTGAMTNPIAKVIDFGISKTGDTPGTALTKTGMIMGTPSYMAPEQARGERVDHRADIYAVGAILYCALTGRRPFDRGDPTATLTAVLMEDPPRPRSIEPSIPEALEMIIQRAMAKMPADRYQTMAELEADLAPYDPGDSDDMAAPSSRAMGVYGPVSMASRPASASLDRQAREVGMARPLIVLMTGLAIFWVFGGLVTTIAAIVRMVRSENLSSFEATLLVLGIFAAGLTPAILIVRHLVRAVWGNSVKAVNLADKLRAPVVVGLGAYGFASLLVRFIEEVLLRRSVGVAWPVWDLLLFGVGLIAALSAMLIVKMERQRA